MQETFGTADLAWQLHEVPVPLDHDRPERGEIVVSAREVVARDRRADRLPWLLWLQGGPGNRAERPVSRSPWLAEVLGRFRVLLLDQRGTGRSTPVTRQTVDRFASPADLADHLALHRADSIVRDAELVRRALLGERTWTVLGESYGGFCAVSYLSHAPDGLAGALISGGLPPLVDRPDPVYRATYRRVLANNDLYWSRHPGDRDVARAIVDVLETDDVRLPAGERLTGRRFQTLGLQLGKAELRDGLHYLVEDAFVPGSRVLSDLFLSQVDALVSFRRAPLYAVLHESIYCAGAAAGWSAERLRAAFPQFDLGAGGPVHLTGEMIYPWMFTEDPALRPFRAAADLLAARTDWPPLVDADRLKSNAVPVAAAIYRDDMYVDSNLSARTAEAVGALRAWHTDEFEHDGLWVDRRVTRHLLDLLDEAS